MINYKQYKIKIKIQKKKIYKMINNKKYIII